MKRGSPFIHVYQMKQGIIVKHWYQVMKIIKFMYFIFQLRTENSSGMRTGTGGQMRSSCQTMTAVYLLLGVCLDLAQTKPGLAMQRFQLVESSKWI